MLAFILARLKAVVALLVPAVTAAIITSIEGGLGIDIPTEIEVAIMSFVTGIFVHQVPNIT